MYHRGVASRGDNVLGGIIGIRAGAGRGSGAWYCRVRAAAVVPQLLVLQQVLMAGPPCMSPVIGIALLGQRRLRPCYVVAFK